MSKSDYIPDGKDFYRYVQQFYDLTGQRRPAKPTPIDAQRRNVLMAYLLSEALEFGSAHKLADQLDAAVDLLYFVMDVFVELGINPLEPFHIVHKANMDKVWPDGSVKWEHSVIPPRLLKPHDWVGPEAQLEEHIIKLLE